MGKEGKGDCLRIKCHMEELARKTRQKKNDRKKERKGKEKGRCRAWRRATTKAMRRWVMI